MLVNSLHSLDLTSRQLIHPALTPLVGGGDKILLKVPLLKGDARGIEICATTH